MAACARPGCLETTARSQTAGSMWTLTRYHSITPRVNSLLDQGPIKGQHWRSLGPPFRPTFRALRNMVKPAFALALYSEFLTRLSRPLGAPDIFSGAYRPSPTAHQMLFPFRLAIQFLKDGVPLMLHNSWRNCFGAPIYSSLQKPYHNIRLR